LVELLFTLGQLLAAGASMSVALATARSHGQSRDVVRFCTDVERALAGGSSTAVAFASALGGRSGYIPALIAAGESGGDLPGALRGVAEQLRAEAAIRATVWGAVSYPLFIAVASVIALLMLLLVVVPSLTPLIEEAGGASTGALGLLTFLSHAIRHGWPWMLGGLIALALGLTLALRHGMLQTAAERMLLDGPARPLAAGLIYGGLACALGRLLSAGVPAPDAFRLAAAGTRVGEARKRVLGAMRAIYDGASVATALSRCRGLPPAIIRMATLGEETGALGPVLLRVGEFEQASAMRTIEAFAKVLAPALIIVLGVAIGGVMAALLSAMTSLGDAILN
jgi:general secretion pathway protein F